MSTAITLTFSDMEGISLPVPGDWTPGVNPGCFSGPAGMLDPRVAEVEDSPIDEERVRLTKQVLSGKGAEAELLATEVPCLFVSYTQSGNLVNIYAVGLSGGRELNAVYVFLPGFENLAAAIKSKFVRNLTGGDDSPSGLAA